MVYISLMWIFHINSTSFASKNAFGLSLKDASSSNTLYKFFDLCILVLPLVASSMMAEIVQST